MPFQSKAQMRKCFAMKGRGQAKDWNCEEWAHKTKDIKDLPYKKPDGDNGKEAAVQVVIGLEKKASSISELLGIRAAALSMGMLLPQ